MVAVIIAGIVAGATGVKMAYDGTKEIVMKAKEKKSSKEDEKVEITVEETVVVEETVEPEKAAQDETKKVVVEQTVEKTVTETVEPEKKAKQNEITEDTEKYPAKKKTGKKNNTKSK